MKRLLSIILLLTLFLSSISVNVFAIPAPLLIGDANADGKTDIKDATAIQKYLVLIADFGKLNLLLADADKDGEITIKDSTTVQKHLAEIHKIEYEGIFTYLSCEVFYADYNSGKAMVGVPVTFTVEGSNSDSRANPIVYELFIDDELVDTNSSNGSFTYVFDKAGKYRISVKLSNEFFVETTYILSDCYVVAEPYESENVMIKSLYAEKLPYYGGNTYMDGEGSIRFVADAMFGCGEYEYAFYLDTEMVRDFSEDNTFTLEQLPHYREEHYILTVTVKDSLGKTASESTEFFVCI